MESEVIKKFNLELSSIHESKAPSKAKIQEITKSALKAKSLYKHVVFSIERFLLKCKAEHRLHVLYVIDSIIRASKHQFKEKDVFATRFLKSFDKILRSLLASKPNEQLKVVRTLNLWLANGVFTNEEIAPFRQQCQQAGLEIDFEAVERAVKGKAADMRIYGGTYIKKSKLDNKQHRSTTPTMPPPPIHDGLLGAAPPPIDLPTFQPSDDIMDGTISQREMLNLIQQCGCDKSGFFSKDPVLLSKAHEIFASQLRPKIDAHDNHAAQLRVLRQTNIKNVLTADFEYSDDEEDKEKEEEEAVETEEMKELTHEQILNMASEMIKNQDVVNALSTMVQEKLVALNNASAIIRNQISAASTIPTTIPVSMPAVTQPNLAMLGGLPTLGQLGQINPAALHQAIQQNRHLAGGSQLPPNALNIAQLQASQQRNLLGLLGNPLLGMVPPGLGLHPGLQPPQQNQLDITKQLNMQPLGVPPPIIPQNVDTHIEKEEMSEREREKDRSGRRERDRSRDRERRKNGLPSLKNGITYIASRTLWFKKVPANCTESDLKSAVDRFGEASRIKIIGNRACAYVTMESRKSANEVIHELGEVSVAKKMVKVNWARGPGMNDEPFFSMWDSDRGVIAVPHDKLPSSLEKLCEGATLDIDSLPDEKKGMYQKNGEMLQISIPQQSASQSSSTTSLPTGIPQYNFSGMQLPPGIPPGFQPLGVHPSKPPQQNFGAPPPMGIPPPPGLAPTYSNSSAAPPPPGVAPLGFDPTKKPPPMGAMGPFGAGPLPQQIGMSPFGGGGRGGGPPSGFRGGFRGGRGGPGFDGPRRGGGQGFGQRGGRFEESSRYENSRDRDSDRWGRDRSSGGGGGGGSDRRRHDDDRRRSSRWGDDERRERRDHGERDRERDRDRNRDRDRDHHERRGRSGSRERRSRRSPSYDAPSGAANAPGKSDEREENKDEKKEQIRATATDDEILVSSTTLDDTKESAAIDTVMLDKESKKAESVDQTDEVPMDLE